MNLEFETLAKAASVFDVNAFLEERNLLLVHFSTAMNRHGVYYSEQLQVAKTLSAPGLCCSTIGAADIGYCDPRAIKYGAMANSGGCVGIIVRPRNTESIVCVSHMDAGSYYDECEGWQAKGVKPSEEACLHSVDGRFGMNEWVVTDFSVVGLFAFPEICVYRWIGEDVGCGFEPSNVEEIARDFPRDRLIGNFNDQYRQYTRSLRQWHVVSFDDI